MFKTSFCVALIFVLGSIARGQGTPDSGPATMVAPMLPAVTPKVGLSVAADVDLTPVKGAPFCAVIVTEHTQPFADGNRIHTSDSSTLCRDSEGRTRREAGLNLLGAAAQQPKTKLITIVDPVAGYRYMLDTSDKTARRMALPPNPAREKGVKGVGVPAKADNVMYFRTAEAPGADVAFGTVFVNHESGAEGQTPATENLGDQMIDGVHATGTRVMTTIPTGKMGNEQPILVTSERWYSPELKATVMTKHNDPWAGELKTQFTSVNTSEPDTSLFTVPSDYRVVEEKAGPFMIRLPPPGPDR
jgi:hypothetical protein